MYPEIERLFTRYTDHMFAYINGVDVLNPITGERSPPNVRFLERVEEYVGVRHFAHEVFRRDLALQIARYSANKMACDVTCFPMLQAGIERLLMADTHHCYSWRGVPNGEDGGTPSASSASPSPAPPPPIQETVSLDDLKSMLSDGMKNNITKAHFTSEGGFWEEN